MKALSRINKVQARMEYDREAEYIPEWELNTVFNYAKGLFEYSKFKIGDIVKLKESPTINEVDAFGWMGYKDILIPETEFVIISVDWHNEEKFQYIIEPNCCGHLGSFSFLEHELEKV